MRIVVLGGGVVGVTTAYQLQKDGHDVVVLERNSEVAAEASWGNAGMIAPGHSFVWSSPKAPMILLKSLFLEHQALRFKFSADPRLYSWSWLFLMECTPEKARRNTLLKHRLATYSQTVLKEVVADETIDYNRSERGILYFHRDQQALDRGVEHMKLLESDGQVIKVLDRDAVVALEPSLASAKSKIAGGIYCPTDETGESAKFARALAAKIIVRGGEVHTGATVIGLATDGDSIAQALTHRGAFKGDAFVLALGAEKSDSRAQARYSAADLSDQGLFAYDTYRQPAVAADDCFRRRAQSRRRLPLRGSNSRYCDRRVRRLRHEAQAVRFRFHEGCHPGPLPRRRGLRPRGDVGGPETDDAQQSSVLRAAALPEPFPQHRTWPHRVDDVARLGQNHGGPDRRAQPGNIHGRSSDRVTRE